MNMGVIWLNLRDLCEVYKKKYKDTSAFYSYITIIAFSDNRHLWEGKISDFVETVSQLNKFGGFIIVEVLVDNNHQGEEHIPPYNRAKILKVI